MKKSIFLFFHVFVLLGFVSAYTWTITPSSSNVSFTSYSGARKNTSKTITINRGSYSGTTYFYLLVSGATTGQFSTGDRRLYYNAELDGDLAQVLLRRSASTTQAEIGTASDTLPIVASGSISNGSTSKSITIYFYTGTGLIPAQTYNNTFTLELFYSSTNLVNGSGQLTGTGTSTGKIVTFNVSLTSISSISMSLGKSVMTLDMVPNTAPYDTTTLSVANGSTSIYYTIQLISANNGYLYKDSGNSVPYLFYFNNSAAPTDLSAGTVTLVSDRYTSKSYNIKVATDSLDMLDEGLYSDILTFIFSTQ